MSDNSAAAASVTLGVAGFATSLLAELAAGAGTIALKVFTATVVAFAAGFAGAAATRLHARMFPTPKDKP
jgi:hypothetical protein